MKRVIVFLLLLCTGYSKAQNQISGIVITMPATMPAATADWASVLPPVSITAQTKPDSNRSIPPEVIESKVLVTIKNGGSKVCGSYTATNAPFAGFNSLVRNWRGGEVEQLLGQTCTLQPGSYTLCVQFYNNGLAISEERCKPFTVKGEESGITPGANGDVTYTGPQAITPADGAVLNEKDAQQPITFRWTPVVPKPKRRPTYIVRVFEVPEGQTGVSAIKTNSPIFEEEVTDVTMLIKKLNLNIGSSVKTSNSKYAWYVEATDKEGKSYGVSGVNVFSINFASCGTNNAVVNIVCGSIVKGKQTYAVSITFNNIISSSGGQQCTTVMSGITSTTGTISGIATIPVTIPIGASSSPVTFIYTPINPLATSANFSYTGIWNDGNNNTSNFSSSNINLPVCKCDLCDNAKWEIQDELYYDSTKTNNILTLHNDVSFGPYKVVKLSAEIVDFYWFTEGDCKKCSSNDYYWGNLISGSMSGNNFTQGVSAADANGVPLPSSHQLDFLSNNSAGAGLSNDVYLNISLPPQTQLGCCTDCFRFCIRYTATFIQDGACKTCSITKCFETKRKHKKTTWHQAINQCGDNIIFNSGGVQDAAPALNKTKN